MPRTLSTVMKQAMNAQETGEVVQALITIEHALIEDGPLRLVSNLQDAVSNGNTYTAFPFQVVLPGEHEDTIPRLRLVVDNVDQRIIAAIRAIPPGTPPMVQVDFILASQPDVVEATFAGFTLRTVDYDALQIEGELQQEEMLNEAFPEGIFTPQDFPGLF